MVSDRIAHSLIHKGGDFAHGYTYSGHPVCAAVAVANIRLMRDEGIIETVANDTGPYFQQRLAELAAHPLVGEARAVGMIGALELVADKRSRSFFQPRGDMGTLCRDYALANGLILRATKDTMLFSPPLVMDKPQIDEMISLTRLSLDQAAASKGIT